MATLATGLHARFGRAGLAPAGLHQEVSPSHLRFLPFHAFPSAITMSALSNLFCAHLSLHSEEWSSWLLVNLRIDDHRLARNLSVGFSPTQTSLRSILRP